MERLCAAQDALLKVHERIVEEGLSGRMAPDYDNENIVVTARLLVPNNMVGCLLGKRGDCKVRLVQAFVFFLQIIFPVVL